jgi:hypothetical protein
MALTTAAQLPLHKDPHNMRVLLEQALHLRDTIAHLCSLVPDVPFNASIAPSAEPLRLEEPLQCLELAALCCSQVHQGALTSEETAELAFLRVLTSSRNTHLSDSAGLCASVLDNAQPKEHKEGQVKCSRSSSPAVALGKPQLQLQEQGTVKADMNLLQASQVQDIGNAAGAEDSAKGENSILAGNAVGSGCAKCPVQATQDSLAKNACGAQLWSVRQKCRETRETVEADAALVVVAHSLDGIQVPYEAVKDLHEGHRPRLWLRVRVPGGGAPEAKACVGSLGEHEIRRLPNGSFEVTPFEPGVSVCVCPSCMFFSPVFMAAASPGCLTFFCRSTVQTT